MQFNKLVRVGTPFQLRSYLIRLIAICRVHAGHNNNSLFSQNPYTAADEHVQGPEEGDRDRESGRVRALIGLSRLGISCVGMGGGKKYGAS